MKPVRLFRRREDAMPPVLGYCRRLNQLDSHCPLSDTNESCPLAVECCLAMIPPWPDAEARVED